MQFDPATGLLSLPIWVTATTAAVLVVLAILAVARSGALKTLFMLMVFGLVVYGGWMGWLMFERMGDVARVDERRAYDQRLAELTARATAPNSVLSCLDSAIEAVATGCEKVLFGSPENVTGAVAYVSARISLLTDGIELSARSDTNYDAALNVLRRGLENDRFGVVAHVLAQQPNCLPQQCEALSMLNDANRVRMNLQEKPFEALVAKYSPQWTLPLTPRPAVTSETRPLGLAPPAPVSSRYDLPSSASIPPVSIMNSESAPAPASPSAAAAAAPAASPPATPRRPPAVRAPVARAAPAEPPPVPLAPSAATSSAASTPGAAPAR